MKTMNVIIYILTWILIALLVTALWKTLFDDDNDDNDDNYPEPCTN